MVIAAVIILLIAVFAARLVFEYWIHTRKVREVLGLFAQSGALGPASAKTPSEFGLSLSGWRFGLRDYRSEAFRALVSRRLLLETPEGRFYLSSAGYKLHLEYLNQQH